MPAPISRPQLPDANTAARLSYLVQLFFGGSLAVVVLLLGLCAWRLGRLPPSHKPAMERPESVPIPLSSPPQAIVDIEPLTVDAEVVPKARVAVSEAVSKSPAAEVVPKARVAVSETFSKALAGGRPRAPEPFTIDQIVEQRLQASEDDLRRQLSDIPELCLLDDDEVRNLRANEKAFRMESLQRAKAVARSDPRRFLPPAFLWDDRMIRDAVITAERPYLRAAARQQAAAILTARQQAIYQLNANLQQNMRLAALQAGIVLRSGPDCELASSTATDMAELSKGLRDLGFGTVPVAASASRSAGRRIVNTSASQSAKVKALQAWCDEYRVEKMSGTVPTLTQMLQIEDEATRLLLVRELTRIKGRAAATELADRALMDLSPAVRRAAVASLEKRPWQEYSPVLLRGLRYPWPPVADHAAVALRTLKPQEAAAPLIDLLDQPSPSQPVRDAQTNRYSVREMVRLNHLRNCLLCHAPSANANDGLVRGLVPTPGEPLPRLYYAERDGDFVRADITFLRQDFSVGLPVEGSAPWPAEQRFDFVTRLRPVQPDEMSESDSLSDNYPQREAVLYALRGITGKDGGDSSTRWRELLAIALDKKPPR